MEGENLNRIVGALEAIAGGVMMAKSDEYGFGAIGKMAGLYFLAEGVADMITGKFFYLTSKIKWKVFK